jgi:hypothetical protein
MAAQIAASKDQNIPPLGTISILVVNLEGIQFLGSDRRLNNPRLITKVAENKNSYVKVIYINRI